MILATCVCISNTWAADTSSSDSESNVAVIEVAQDAPLRSFVRQALIENPQIRSAVASLDASTALHRAAERPVYNPELEFDAENSDADVRSIGLSQTFDWSGKRHARSQVTLSERDEAEAELALLRRDFTTELLSAVTEYHAAEETRTSATRVEKSLPRFHQSHRFRALSSS